VVFLDAILTLNLPLYCFSMARLSEKIKNTCGIFIGFAIEARTIYKQISMKMTEIITNHTIDRRLLYTRKTLSITREYFYH